MMWFLELPAKITPRPSCRALSDSFIQWTRARIQAAHTCLIDYPDLQIVLNSNLARKTNIGRELSFYSETVSFEFSHFTRVTLVYFDPARRAARVPAARVQHIDPGILLDREDEPLSVFNVDRGKTFYRQFGHTDRIISSSDGPPREP